MRQQAYTKVFNVLRQQILDGDLVPGQKLQAERELCEHFGVSRITVRHAMRLLQESGLVERYPGRGTFVRAAKPRKVPIFSNDFAGSLRTHAPHVQRTLLNHQMQVPPQHVAEAFGLLRGQQCMVAERLDLSDGLPLAYDRAYIPAEFSRSVDNEMLQRLDFYELWLEREGLSHSHSVESIEAIAAEQEQASLLEVAAGAPVLFALDQMHGSDGRVIAVFESFYRGDRFRLVSTSTRKSNVKDSH